MARKGKIGLDYFSHDVNMLGDNKIRFIKAKHGLLGYAVFLRLLEEIYKEKGYYINNGEKFNILFADENKLELNTFIEILNDCINEELFDSNIYKKYGVLTSKRIQLNYLAGVERRQNVTFVKEYLLVNIEQYKLENKKKVVFNADILSLNDNINKENVNKSTQREREREREREMEKENKIKYAENVSMLESEYKKLVTKYKKANTDKMIDILNNYKGANGKKYKSDYRAILSWVVNKIETQQHKNTNNSLYGDPEVF